MKYDVRIFPNGRVVMLPDALIKEATKDGREILLVCKSWTGGYAIAIGETKKYDEEGNVSYARYTYKIGETTFEDDDIYKFSKIIFTEGETIYMKTGDQAMDYQEGKFMDWLSTPIEIREFYKEDECEDRELTDKEVLERRYAIDERGTVRNIMSDIENKVETLIEKKILSEKARDYIFEEDKNHD